MSSPREVIDRVGGRFPTPDDPFDRLARRRDRKRRNQRIGAGALALVIVLVAAGALARAVMSEGTPADEPLPTNGAPPPNHPATRSTGEYNITMEEGGCSLEGREGPVDTKKLAFHLWNSSGQLPVTFDIGRIGRGATYENLVAFVADQRSAGAVGVHRPPFFESPLRGYAYWTSRSRGGGVGQYRAKSLRTIVADTIGVTWQWWWGAGDGPLPPGTYAVVCYQGRDREPVGVVGPVVVR